MDNKKFEVPTTEAARSFKAKLKVRYQIRTRGDGLLPKYTKPNLKRHRKNLGGSLTVCAGVSKDRVVLWRYVDGPWNADVAASIYGKDIKNILRRRCPDKVKPNILEDNDPTGYTSGKAKQVKKELGYNIMSLPRTSPDLNPLAFCIWADIERRMRQNGPTKGRESVEQYKKRLRKTAMSTPRSNIKRHWQACRRIMEVYRAEGSHIKMD